MADEPSAQPRPGAQPRPVTGGAVMTAVSQVTVALTGFLATVAVARLLGPEGTAAFTVALSLFVMLMTVSSLGLESGLTWMVSARRWGARAAHAHAQAAALVLGLGGMAIGLAARAIVPEAFQGVSVALVLVVCAGLPFALSWLFSSYVALAVDAYERYVVAPALQSAVALAGVAGLAVAFGIDGAIAGLAASHVVTALVMLAWNRRRLPRDELPPRAGLPALREATSFGVKSYSAHALQFLNYRLDLFILNAVAASATVGHYSVAISVTSAMWLLPQALSAVVFPRVAQLTGTGDEAQRAMVEEKSLRHVAAITVVSGLALAGALIGLVELVYGSEFRPAIALGLILLPGVSLMGIANVLSATTVGRGFPIYSLYTALITTPPTVVLYLVLVPALEATGAALASTISYALTFALTAHYYRRVTGLRIAPLLVPTRGELDDYRRVIGLVRERLDRAAGAAS